jgi:hypothetical protein
MRHLRTAAIFVGSALIVPTLIFGLPLAVALAQSPTPDVAAAPVAADPLLTLLGSLGPTGGAGVIVAYVLHYWRSEAARHATERAELRAGVTAMERALADLDRRLGRQEDRVALASDALRRALDS